MKAWFKLIRAPWVFLVWENIFLERRCLIYVYKVISHAGPILFCNIQHSGLFCLFVTYDVVQSPGLVHFLSGQPALETPTSPLPFLQLLTSIGITYMNDMKNSLPCWGKCKLRYWIYNRHNPNTKTVLPKNNQFSHLLPRQTVPTACFTLPSSSSGWGPEFS